MVITDYEWDYFQFWTSFMNYHHPLFVAALSWFHRFLSVFPRIALTPMVWLPVPF